MGTLTSAGNLDSAVLRFDAQGRLIEGGRWGGARDDVPIDVAVDAAGDAALLNEVSTLYGPGATAKGLRFDCELDQTLPELLVGDRGRIRQVISNLVGNAVKFTSKGSVGLRGAMVADSAGGARFRVEVSDTGAGVSDEKRGLLFKKFSQADSSTSRRFGGTGLGLAICRELVLLMNGDVDLEVRAGEGSRFYFELPLASAPDAAADQPPAQAERSLAGDWHGARILVAEDNVINQRVALKLLEKLGLRAQLASNGTQAVAMHRASPFDVIFMDCQMPEMDGYQATALIRADEVESGGHVPIIAMTAHAMHGDREACIAAAMDDYTTKPVVSETLRALFTKWLVRPAR